MDYRCLLISETHSYIRWKAKWIAPPDAVVENYYFIARRCFEIAAVPVTAILRIAADSRYALYINGQFIGNGPVRGTHRRYFFDSYDVAPVLKPGVNWIAAEIHCPVTATYTMAPHAPALLAEIEGLAATDASWQVQRDPAHRSDALIYTKQIGYSEWKNMALEPVGWLTGEDGDREWRAAREVGMAADYGGRQVCPRPIAGLSAEVWAPVGIADAGLVPNACQDDMESSDYAALMQNERHMPAPGPVLENIAAFIAGTGPATVQPNSRDDSVFIIMDFGREVFGNLMFDVETGNNCLMDVGHDEGLSDSRLMVKRGSQPYRFADRFELRQGRQLIAQRLHTRGFRYLQLAFRKIVNPLRIHSVRVVDRTYSQKTAASFSCSDSFLVKLWEACVNTVRLCCSDTFMDCVWREQAFWLNDQAMTSLFYLAMTGDRKFAAHNLYIGADGVLPDGMIPFVYPSDRKTLSSSMPALWAMTLADYYLYTGDQTLAIELLPAMEKALTLYDTWRKADGLIPDQPGMWNFADWGYRTAGVAIKGKTAVMNMLIAAAYKQASSLEAALGDAARSDEYARKCRESVTALNTRLWDASRGCYSDCTEPSGPITRSQHPLAIGLAFDLFDEPQRNLCATHLMDSDLIRPELCFQHYILAALVKLGRENQALSVINKHWGPIIGSGSDTIWESMNGRSAFNQCASLCHAFSCTPAYFMQTVVLGVKPSKPGFSEFTIAPRAIGLAHAEGLVPTPHGNIAIRWSKSSAAHMVLDVDIPQRTSARMEDGTRLGEGSHRLVCSAGERSS